MSEDPACIERPSRRACVRTLGAAIARACLAPAPARIASAACRVRLALPTSLPALAACTATFDWREVRCADGAVRCLLPGRPAEMSRRIHLREAEVEMRMTGAQAGGLSFTVASLASAPASPEAARALLDAMREQMLRNVKAAPAQGDPVGVPSVDSAGRRLAPRDGVELSVQSDTMRMKARFFLAHGRPTQAVVMGPQMDDEAARQFLDSVTIVGA